MGKVDSWNMALSRIGETKYLTSEAATGTAAETCRLHWDRIVKAALESARWQFASMEATISRVDTQTISYAGDDSTTKFIIPYGYLSTGDITVELDSVEQTLTTQYTITEGTVAGESSYITMVTAPATGETLEITVTVSRQGWDYLYGLPSDYVKAIAVTWNDVRFDMTGEANRIQFAILTADDKTSQMLACNQLAADAKLEYIALVDDDRVWPALFRDLVVWDLGKELACALRPQDTAAFNKCVAMHRMKLGEARAMDKNAKHSREATAPSVLARGVGDSDYDWPPFRRPV